jgi:hypothetical protein
MANCPIETRGERTVDDRIARLRQRLKQTPMDDKLRALLLGILDLLGDEL